MIAFLRSSTVDYDVRLKKYITACVDSGTDYLAFTWNRLGESVSENPYEFQFNKNAPYGFEHRKRNLFYLIIWQFFLFNLLWKNRKKYQIIHACNIETVGIAFVFKLFFKKKVIFDIYDSCGHLSLERYFARRSDLLILPNEKRLEQEKLYKGDSRV